MVKWEDQIREILEESFKPVDNQQEEEDLMYYLRMLSKMPENKEIVSDITEMHEDVLRTYIEIVNLANNNPMKWETEREFDSNLYAAMLFVTLYLSKAWKTIDDSLPPIPIMRIFAYALVVGIRIGKNGNSLSN